MIGYVKHFDITKKCLLRCSDNKLLKKYTKIWGRASNLMNIKFDSESIYSDNDISTKIKLYGDKINTNFQGNKNTKRKRII